ncbi:hypothetical protein DL239_09110 [Sedimentitalea sp. CY04]|uniref:Uncharacterized protein n=1 Tax=Parasedimentitalea denitrificans TaxID=2211118 RepID=A0ABX0W673_9RHOB|nr:hypothetical protein [Sedimentitalea sp. CY04]NIZ61134.1 hypothetical protein [Sedimentitalea sp. CY04]
MAIVQNICFAATCGLVALGVDYHQQSRRAQMPLGQMGLSQYASVLNTRLFAIEGVSTINLTAFADLTASLSLVNGEEPADPTLPQVMGDPDRRESRTGVRVNKGLSRDTTRPVARSSISGCVRRGTILNC